MKNPPYEHLTTAKWNSLGKTMTLKDALDCWWNSIRVRTSKGILCCYKCHDNTYEHDGIRLDRIITLDNEYDEDADGYPIVFATAK